jgi:S-adenosylmethionine:tRNA ribosyltransferase-isomerase
MPAKKDQWRLLPQVCISPLPSLKNLMQKYFPAICYLHVGAGTFKPVKSETLAQHEMHAEFIDITAATIKALLTSENIYAVGTTSANTGIVYWMGVKVFTTPGIELHDLEIQQWEVYGELSRTNHTTKDALMHLLSWMHNRNLKRLICRTRILIAPGYSPRVANGIITNFHQPQSTLLLLIAALIGDEWKRIYKYALDNDFRSSAMAMGC